MVTSIIPFLRFSSVIFKRCSNILSEVLFILNYIKVIKE
jgi:hypothetical protein